MKTVQDQFLFKRSLWMPGWGEITLSALVLALISGIVMIPPFKPGPGAFESVSRIISAGLFGRFIHQFHSLSGDIFLVGLVMHTGEYLLRRTYKSYPFKPWFYLILLVAASILTVFSGFLSIGSKQSHSAARILDGVLNVLGVAGETVSSFLLQLKDPLQPLMVVYTHHAATFSIITIILVYIHIRRLKAERYALIYTALLISVLAFIVPVNIGLMPDTIVEVVKGPWYFVGLQEMLAWMPAAVAGIIFPLLLIVLLALLPVIRRNDRPVLYLLAIIMVFYIGESVIGTIFRGAGWQLLGR